MKILYEDGDMTCVFFETKAEGKNFVAITSAALEGKKLNKQSSAYKMAKKIDDNLPVF